MNLRSLIKFGWVAFLISSFGVFSPCAAEQSIEPNTIGVEEALLRSDYRHALELLESLPKEKKQTGEYHFLKAYTHNRLGQFEKALVSIEQAKTAYKYFTPRLDFEAAWATLNLKRFDESIDHSSNFLNQKPEDENGAKLLSLAQLASQVPTSSSLVMDVPALSASVGLNFGYNDNVIGLGQDQLLPSEIDNEAAMFVGFSANANYKKKWLEKNTVDFRYSLSTKFYRELSNFNSQFHRIGIRNQTRISKRLGFEAGAEFNDYLLDAEEFRHQVRLHTNLYFKRNEQNRSSLGIDFANNNYRFDFSTPSLNRDSNERSLFALHEMTISSFARLRFRAELGEGSSKGDEFDNDYFGLSSSAQIWIPKDFITFMSQRPSIQFSASYRAYDYENSSAFSSFGIKRNDDSSRYGVVAYAPLTKELALYLAYFRLRNVSNIDVYNYSQNQTSFGFAQRF